MKKKGVKNNFFCIKSIHRNSLDNKGYVQLENLEKYLEHAKKLIRHFSKPKFSAKTSCASMVYNDDAVAHVAHYIMLADMAYDPNKNTKLSTFRANYAYYAILDIYRLSKLKKNKPKPTIDRFEVECADKDISQLNNSEEINYYINHSGLSQRDKSIFVDHFINGSRGEDITQKYNLTKEGVRFVINKCLSKIKLRHERRRHEKTN